MPGVTLYPHQREALDKIRNGSVLMGGVGSGKSRTALAYYYIHCGGSFTDTQITRMKHPQKLVIITTARKRDTLEWDDEMLVYNTTGTVDSWNNIKKYMDVKGAFFIFDEQRLVGNGAWVKAFLKIVKHNDWILLSATPGDSYMDYIPLFLAHGFYKNRTEFIQRHVVYSKYCKFPKVERYLGTKQLDKYREQILVPMDFKRKTERHVVICPVSYDQKLYDMVMKKRWNPYKEQPLINAGELCYTLRKVVNSHESRIEQVRWLVEEHHRCIIFYNYDYELDILKAIDYPSYYDVAEWNSHKHQLVPGSDYWVYLVQYAAGAEAWNCITTDTIIFYSDSYSYKVMEQASGRIDRANTPYRDLYYYRMQSEAKIDKAVSKALKDKKDFNEKIFIEGRKRKN